MYLILETQSAERTEVVVSLLHDNFGNWWACGVIWSYSSNCRLESLNNQASNYLLSVDPFLSNSSLPRYWRLHVSRIERRDPPRPIRDWPERKGVKPMHHSQTGKGSIEITTLGIFVCGHCSYSLQYNTPIEPCSLSSKQRQQHNLRPFAGNDAS